MRVIHLKVTHKILMIHHTTLHKGLKKLFFFLIALLIHIKVALLISRVCRLEISQKKTRCMDSPSLISHSHLRTNLILFECYLILLSLLMIRWTLMCRLQAVIISELLVIQRLLTMKRREREKEREREIEGVVVSPDLL